MGVPGSKCDGHRPLPGGRWGGLLVGGGRGGLSLGSQGGQEGNQTGEKGDGLQVEEKFSVET